MKKCMLLLVLLAATAAWADTTQITDFDTLMGALNQGEQVRVIIRYGDCKLIADNEETKAPNAVGGMDIDVFEYFAPGCIGNPKGFVVFSHASLINHRGFIYNYAKIKVSDDNTVKITAQYTDPKTFELKMDEAFYSTINDGKQGAVYFYKAE